VTEKKDETPEGGPCPPVEGDDQDNALANETAADYDAEEKDEVTE